MRQLPVDPAGTGDDSDIGAGGGRPDPVAAPPVSPLMRPAEAADTLGLTPRQLAALSARGEAPEALRIGPRTLRYRRADIDAARSR
jgi:predicted DNA-binding transcriptional regulator AlpA